MKIQLPEPSDYIVITTATTTLVKSRPGVLQRILLTSTQTFTAMVYDNIEGSGRVIANFNIGAADKLVGQWDFMSRFYIGLTIVTTGTPPLTVIFD